MSDKKAVVNAAPVEPISANWADYVPSWNQFLPKTKPMQGTVALFEDLVTPNKNGSPQSPKGNFADPYQALGLEGPENMLATRAVYANLVTPKKRVLPQRLSRKRVNPKQNSGLDGPEKLSKIVKRIK